jgi:hypothetical protein
MSDIREPNRHAENVGKYTCTRCGWQWAPRPHSPDPPHACARCRSAYWQSTPVSSRGNSPSDPKWRAESQSLARRRQKRRFAGLKELAAEFDFALSPIRDDLSIAPPVFPLPQESSQPAEPRSHFNEPVPSRENSVPAPRGSLVEELRRRMAADANVAAPK